MFIGDVQQGILNPGMHPELDWIISLGYGKIDTCIPVRVWYDTYQECTRSLEAHTFCTCGSVVDILPSDINHIVAG